MRLWVVFLALLSALFADSPQQIVKLAMEHNRDLQALRILLQRFDKEIDQSALWSDPVLAFAINDIPLQAPLQRDREPMQTQMIALKQTIPYPGKKRADIRVAKEKKSSFQMSIHEARAKLAKIIYDTIIAYRQNSQTLALLQRYVHLMRHNIALYTSTLPVDAKAHMALMKSELFLTNLKTQITSLQGRNEALLQKLSALAGTNITKISPLNVDFSPYKTTRHNVALQKIERQIALQEAIIQRRRLDTKSDMTLGIGYYNRADFDDYVSVSLSMPLPIYGNEKLHIQKAKITKLSLIQKRSDLALRLQKRLSALQIERRSIQKQIAYIENDALRKLSHMFDLAKSAIASGGDIYRYIDLLEERFSLELRLISLQNRSLRIQNEMSYITGVYR